MPGERERRALLALAAGGFVIGTGDFVTMRLPQQVAADLAASFSGDARMLGAGVGAAPGRCAIAGRCRQ
jgi:predicted MFS family arabinose efflux permease